MPSIEHLRPGNTRVRWAFRSGLSDAAPAIHYAVRMHKSCDQAQPTGRPREHDVRQLGRTTHGLRLRLYTIIFEADTRAGRLFDLTLIGLILGQSGGWCWTALRWSMRMRPC